MKAANVSSRPEIEALLVVIAEVAKCEFSVDRFIGPNGYAGLSPQARAALFKSTGKGDLAAALDDIFTVSKGVEEKLRQFRNRPEPRARSRPRAG